MKLPSVQVTNGAVLEVRWTFGQLGPDAPLAGGSTWVIGPSGVAGTLRIGGDHTIGFDQLYIGAAGEMDCVSSATLRYLTYIAFNTIPNGWSPYVLANHGTVDVAVNCKMDLAGGTFNQSALVSVETPITTLHEGSTLQAGTEIASAALPDYAVDITAGKLIAYEKVSVVSQSNNMEVNNAVVEFYCPGVFTINNGPPDTSTLTFWAGGFALTQKEALFDSTIIQYLDYDPGGRYTSATQVGGRIDVAGKCTLQGSTELDLRADLANHVIDSIGASGTFVLSGDGLILRVDVRNPGNLTLETFSGFLTGMTLTAPPVPFGGGMFATGAGSVWTPTITTNASSLDLTLTLI